MDLDDFDGLVAEDVSLQSDIAKDAVEFFDNIWYSDLNRRGRWMDLMGDYAGTELFVIDGDSLLQLVLDDPLLALGRPDDLRYQILHAKYLLEKILSDFLTRHALFEVVFWHGHRHASQLTGDSVYTVSSRILARHVLCRHLGSIPITVHRFQDLDDPRWKQYLLMSKPMFVMLNDGGVLEKSAPYVPERLLLQRLPLFQLITQGLPLALLRGAEFRDSKILTFVFEQNVKPAIERRLKGPFRAIVNATIQSLEHQESLARGVFTPATVPGSLNDEAENVADARYAVARFVKAAAVALKTEPAFAFTLLHTFVTHIFLLPSLSIENRARKNNSTQRKLTKYLRDTFLPTMFFAMESTQCGVDVDLDGAIFLELLRFMQTTQARDTREAVPPAIYAEVETIWESQHLPRPDYAKLTAAFPVSGSKLDSANSSDPSEDIASLGLLPFANPVFDELFSSPLLQGVDDESSADESARVPFTDNSHWHNHRRAILPRHQGGKGSDDAPLTDWQRKRKLRSEQRFMAKMQWQAASLVGASGKALQRITIVSGQRRETTQPKPRAIGAATDSKSKNKGKKNQMSKADIIRQNHAEKKREDQDASNAVWWGEQLQKMSDFGTARKIAQTERLLNNQRAEDGWLAVELRLYRIHLHFLLWLEDPLSDGNDEAKSGEVRDRFSVSIMRMVKELYERGGLFPKASTALASALRALGFEGYVESLQSSSPNPSSEDRSLTFKFVKLLRSKTNAPVHKFMPIVEDPIEWQMRLFGEFMDRNMDGQPDRRVSFIPDAWQRKVLDCLDADHSLLVVAPTSAGKTFISYYAMEQVLRESDQGVLVYVAPTKALVSQIAAEVYARFNKDFKSSGTTCWSIHTRDYRINNPQNCQILVTVPEMLAIMLLSPPLAGNWVPRIKRIILDEIHTIGQQDGGAVWEQIILLAPCPIIGLSATIGEPEKFNAWLASVQEAHGYQHTYINHPYRYSHLRKFFYALGEGASSKFKGLDDYQDTTRLRFLHPVSILGYARLLPPDFSLEAADCLSLFSALENVHAKGAIPFKVDIDSLRPSRFLARNTFLQQKDIIAYENALKGVLTKLITVSDPQMHQSPLSLVVSRLQDPMVAQTSPFVASAKDVLSGIVHLVSDLYTKGDLPALMFLFDRSGCEIAAQHLLAALQAAEEQWRKSNAAWKSKLEQWEYWKSQAAARRRAADQLLKANKKAAEDRRDAKEATWEESFDPNDPSPQFSFLGTKVSKEHLEAAIAELSWTSTPTWVLDALRRGIGIHHSGMNKHYRTTVESLYRMGYLQVVFATGTLALGINAPTKTSVFCADSPFLTALMYRQCAGRAGRRGFDLLGKVVFYGLSLERVQRLVLSRLPSLGGSFPLTATMVLRLFNLLQGSNYAPTAINAIKSILNLPQVSFVHASGRQEIMHHVRFSIDYLRRSELMGPDGSPINLFGLATHLYYTEPSNFAIVALLREGVIHKICTGAASTEDAKRELLVLLCHLFGRRYVPKVYTSGVSIKVLLAKSPSKVILPPMPKKAKEVLKAHDQKTLRVFAGYALAYATAHSGELPSDGVLPLSNKSYAGSDDVSPFAKHLRSTALTVTARSLFVANSGHSDRFNDVDELVSTVRSGIHLKDHGIPSLQHLYQENKNKPLNAYLYDFYMHGQVEALVRANGIRRGEIWYLLQDFVLTLKTIRASIEQLFLKTESEDGDEEAAVDPAEMDGDEVQDRLSLERPKGVSGHDWRVCEVLHQLTDDFEEKFRAMWA